MSSKLRAALLALVKAVEDQERAFRSAQQEPQEFFIMGRTRKERKKNDPRYNETAGARVAAEKDVVRAARALVALCKEEGNESSELSRCNVGG